MLNNYSIFRHFYRLKTGIGLAYLPDNSIMKKREITSEFTTNVETNPDGYIQLVESSTDSFLLPYNNPIFRHFYRLKTGIGLAYLPDNNNMKQNISNQMGSDLSAHEPNMIEFMKAVEESLYFFTNGYSDGAVILEEHSSKKERN